MTDPEKKAKKERNDIGAAIFIAVLTIALILPNYARDVFDGTFNTALSAAVPEGLGAHNLDGGAYWMLMTALILKIVAIFAAAGFIFSLARTMQQGKLFDSRSTRSLNGLAVCIFVWAIARFGIEGMGNNWAASDLGIDWWGDQTGTPLAELAIPYIAVCVLILFSVAIKRGSALEEDVDGLV